MKKYISITSKLIVLVLIFGLGYFLGESNQPSIGEVEGLVNKEPGQDIGIDFSLFWDAWRVIEKDYVNRGDLNRQNMIYGAITGLLDSLDDPYSVFMEPENSKKFLDDIKGSFEGIGAEIGMRKGILTVISPLEGNPAQKAGLRAGDKILKVDDTLTADLTLDEAVNLIRGEKGVEVILLVARDDWDEAKEINIIRDIIQIPIIKWEMKDNNIAYVQFYHFTENSANQFENTIKEIFNAGAQGLILDVRNNPGGYLDVAVDIASWFLPKRELVVTEDYGDGNKNEHLSKGYQTLEDMPTVVLINQGSASASEILAGALRDIRGIQLVGQKSFGKGSVQQLEKMRGGSSIKITVAKWLTPSGISIAEEGIMPDFEIEITNEDFEEMRDPQLNKALELLTND
ncbi:S41 family peptidase [Patescibacteria group bacterium]|nr:S41 family peptidase [Patescibacteria group bacterium]MBU1563646.1 S41 family peptidase [Patescibacteria group bacterium]